MADIKTSGTFKGKSNDLGYGGRAAQLEAKGVPGGVIGNLARAAGAAPGGPNYHGKRKAGANATDREDAADKRSKSKEETAENMHKRMRGG